MSWDRNANRWVCVKLLRLQVLTSATGDPLEVGAIASVFCPGRSPEWPLIIGSVKTNIGHLEGASGVAGLIKLVLMLEGGIILPNRNFNMPNKRIPFNDWNLKVSSSPARPV